MAEDRIPPRDEEDPRERDLSRRSGNAPLAPWVILGLICMLGVVVYLVSGVLG
ncbi:hypothetical protein [Brevundimonas sp. NIBR11]|uniref:hypothetical protein n=1 Tax=Brevundimonas sp. NIBR11 TaxID=3015999 RepID=UPI0022F0A75A|nr:hypothetical protein [Brevundimonas sp. NIBR11]WGM31309.1 hypothetical protein KKHFBJBL_01553 [Brevundimonas sp. NIBR11]